MFGGPSFGRGGDRGDDGSRSFGPGGGPGGFGGRFGRSNETDTASVDRASYRFSTPYDRLPEGLPSWFGEKDTNRDAQIMMSEFARDWTDSMATEFLRYDHNGDGVLTTGEVIAGPSGEVMALSGSASPSFGGSTGGSSLGGGSMSLVSRSSSGASAAPSDALLAKYKRYAEGQVKSYDTNKDGSLDAGELAKMSRKPANPDGDGDGKVTADELAAAMAAASASK